MVLIDAIYINNGGGKVLLDYLVYKLEGTDLKIFYLFDDRIEKQYNIKDSNVSLYQNSSLKLRYRFYKENSFKFSKVLVLGNIPPPIGINTAVVYTYFHNTMYLKVPSDFTLVEKLKYILKVFVINKTKKNTDYWLLQSNTLQKQFVERFGEKSKIKVLPFYPSLEHNNFDIKREKHTFIYVSNAQANKNHLRLISAFCDTYDKTKSGKLILTVSSAFPLILEKIEEAVLKGYPIENIGFVNRNILTLKYLESEFVIFPSLTESFGLGLIEGVELGCKIIAADLPYTYAVIEPSLVFNPNDINSISNTIFEAIYGKIKYSNLKVENKIENLLNILS